MPGVLQYGRPRRALPRARQRINWDHPLAQGLVWCEMPRDQRELVTGLAPSSAPANATATRYGQGLGTTAYSNATTSALAFTSGPFTVMSVARIADVSNYWDLFSRLAYSSESVNSGWAIQHRPGSGLGKGIGFVVFNNNGELNYALTPGTAATVGDYVVAGVSDGTTRSLWINGVRANTTTNNPSPASTAGDLASGSTSNVLAVLNLAWKRALPTDQILAAYDDPFQMLEEPPRRYLFISPATASTTQALQGSIDATSSISGTLSLSLPLAGTIGATSSLSATLTVTPSATPAERTSLKLTYRETGHSATYRERA